MARTKHTIKMTEGDTAPAVTFTVKRSNSAVNLTGKTVRFKIENSSGTRTNSGTDTCVLTTPTSGICTYNWGASDIPTEGTYTADLEITHADSTVETEPAYYEIQVRAGA